MTPHRETINAHNAAVEREGTDMTDRPAIKPLEWREDWGGTLDNIPEWRANTPIGTLTVSIAGHRDESGRRYERHSDVPNDLKSRLIASAFEHYASRIRSRLLDKPEAVEGVATPSPQLNVGSRWRVFEDTTHGYWGIEIDGDGDADPILYPIKINRGRLDRIVDAHNAEMM